MSIKIVAIGGSVRPDNFTWKAVSLAADEIKKHKEVHLDLVDPRELEMPLPGLGSNDQMRASILKSDG